jgi:hypothetical protein
MQMINKDTECPEGFPEHLWGGFKRYVLYGVPPGSFLNAFFEGDFHEVCRRGGKELFESLWPVVLYLHNYCPAGCYGSFDRVQDWVDNGGLLGLEETGT